MKANKININHKYLLPFLHHLIMTVRCLSHAKTHIDDLQFIVFYWWYYANFTFIYNKLYQLFICKVKALFAAQSTSTLLKFAGIHMNQFLVYFFSQIIYPALHCSVRVHVSTLYIIICPFFIRAYSSTK